MVGGKWWKSYWDYRQATVHRSRMMYPDEREVLFLDWPEEGGVWVLRYDNQKQVVGDIGTIYNALAMEERCKAIEISGGTFFENPEECDFTRPLLKSFGEHNRKDFGEEDGGWWDQGTRRGREGIEKVRSRRRTSSYLFLSQIFEYYARKPLQFHQCPPFSSDE